MLHVWDRLEVSGVVIRTSSTLAGTEFGFT